MVAATGDDKVISKRTFAKIALTRDEGEIMSLLSTLKDRGNIKNKGAWLVSVASKCKPRQIIKADEPKPPPKRPRPVVHSGMSPKQWLRIHRAGLADKLGLTHDEKPPNQHSHSVTRNHYLADLKPT